MFPSFFGDFRTGFGYVFAGAFDGVAGGQKRRRPSEDNKANEGNCKIPAHDGFLWLSDAYAFTRVGS
jgi:hypothetical protein